MTETKIKQACRKAFTGFKQNDSSDLLALLSEDVVLEFTDSLPYGGVYRGAQEFKDYWRQVFELWEYFAYDAHAIVEAEDYVIVPVAVRARSRAGIEMENEHVILFKQKDGMITYCRVYADTAKGRDALAGKIPPRFDKGHLI